MIKIGELREEISTNYRAIIARAYARIIGLGREPSWIAFEVILPLLTISAYVYLYKALDSEETYIGYVILGGTMIGFWMNILWGMAAQLYWEKERGQLELILIAPFSRMSLLLGMALGGIYTTSLRAIFTFLLGVLIFKVQVHVSSWGLLILSFFLTLLALYGLGMLGSSLFLLCGRNVFHLSSLFQEPVFLLSGFYFPVKCLGSVIALIASAIPVTLGLDSIRQILFSNTMVAFLPLPTEIELLAAQSLLYFLLANKALHFMEEKARREGRLTLRWQ